jgi:hypothetical protein
MRARFYWSVTALSFAVFLAHAQIPQLISYQGRMLVSGTNYHGAGQFKFALVGTNQAGATVSYWSNDATSVGGTEPGAAVTLSVNDGLYSVLLGDATVPNMRILPATVFANTDVRLRIWFSPEGGSFEELAPDQRIAAVGYAMMAGTAANVADGAITSAKLAAGAITAEKLGTSVITADKLADGAVTGAKLATGSVTAQAIAPGAIGPNQMARRYDAGRLDLSGTVPELDANGNLDVNLPFHFPFSQLPIFTYGVEDTTLTGTSPQVTLIGKTVTNVTLRLSQIDPTFSTVASNVPRIPPALDADFGSHNSLVVVNGNPAMSFYHEKKKALLYVRADDSQGSLWSSPVTVDPGPEVGTGSRLLVVAGNPAIAYALPRPNGGAALYYVRALDPDGETWGAPVPVVSSNVWVRFSVAIVQGNPAIVFTTHADGQLKFIRARDTTGSSWGNPVTVDNQTVYAYPSLQVVQGFPAIACCDLTQWQLSYVRATDAAGTGWSAMKVLDNGRGITLGSGGNRSWTNTPTAFRSGRWASLAIIDGRPAIAYQAQTAFRARASEVRYLRALDAEGVGWPVPCPVMHGEQASTEYLAALGERTQLVDQGGKPFILYRYVGRWTTGGEVSERVATLMGLDGDGRNWERYTYPAVVGEALHFSLAMVGGFPACGWYNENQLKYSLATAVNGSTWPDSPKRIALPALDVTGLIGQTILGDGMPWVAFHDPGKGDLKSVKALNATGTQWSSSIQTIDSGGNAGMHSTLAIGPGGPLLAYRDQGTRTLKLIRHDGLRWGQPSKIAAAADNGIRPCLTAIKDSMGLAFIDAARALRFGRALNEEGTVWSTWSKLDVNLDTNVGPSLGAIGGNAAVAYSDGQLKFLLLALKGGGAPVVVRKAPVGSVSLGEVNGRPAIAFYDLGLYYVRANEPEGLTWPTPVKVDLSGRVGEYASLRVVNGRPAIAYYDRDRGDLRFVRAQDADGTAWETAQTLDSGGDVGQFANLMDIEGVPGVVYWAGGTTGDLKYIKATNADAKDWGVPVLIDSGGTVGEFASAAYDGEKVWAGYYDRSNGTLKAATEGWNIQTLDGGTSVGRFLSTAVMDGNPCLSYYDEDNGDLKFTRALNTLGTSWGTARVLDATGDVGLYTSLAAVNGNPAIAYYDNSLHRLKYVRATVSAGSSWATPVVVDANGNVGLFASLAVVSGNPAIAYYDQLQGDLKFVRANDANGTTWSAPQTPDPGDVGQDVGRYSSLAVVNGRPAIAYYDARFTEVKYIRANDANGTVWGTYRAIDKADDVGLFVNLKVISGKPVISYYNQTKGQLKLLRAKDADGTAWGEPVVADPGNGADVGRFAVLGELHGIPSISYLDQSHGNIKNYYPFKPFQINWFAVEP